MTLPPAYQTHTHQLAVGFEPIDRLRGQRTTYPVRIEVESPVGVAHRPNREYADTSRRADVVARIGRGEHGTHHMLYLKRNPMPSEMLLRIGDDHRRFVPRRFRLAIPLQLDASAEQRPLESRKQTPLLMPGAGYDISRKATGLRGRVLRDGKPMRWAWVQAYYLINVGTDSAPDFRRQEKIGNAISDDRGEFLLVLNTMPVSSTGVADLTSTLWINVVIHGPSPAPSALSSDDPLWDLPIEPLAAAGELDPATDENYVPPGYAADISPQGNRNIPFRLGGVITGLEVDDFVCNLL